MGIAPGSKEEQVALWNGGVGRNWVEAQALIDDIFKPFEDRLAEAAGGAQRVLDVGCGTGAVSLAIARRTGASVTGADISEPMLAHARARAEQAGASVCFIQADAETYAFEPAAFDAIVSRFGVMFFGDSVRAFANLRRAAKPNGALTFAAWRSAEENPFMTTAERAAAPYLPALPPRTPNAPGQFAFADPDRVRGVLEQSGWRAIAIDPIDVPCTMPARDLDFFLTRLGPLGRALPDADEATRTAVMAAVHEAFRPYIEGDAVRFVSACWIAQARA
ncbi:MAG: class I SAM-dependent methyltransferase [Hydrogenophilaceae bacterium]|jgi:SAM-dependent methyltransferase|nr:class I SAM-dependent methyltransferase [Hydrogenophilaceae bacterium]